MNEEPATPSAAYTTQEVAALFKVSIRSVQRLVARRSIEPIRIGRSVRFSPEDVHRLLRNQQ